jgi:16S rRNA (cytidine1402-2'-O)-methyltransferase
MTGRLILLPNLLAETEVETFSYLPQVVEERVQSLDGIIAESEKGARRYLKRFCFPEGRSFRDVPICLLNEHTEESEIKNLLQPVLEGKTWGIVSDAGLPCLADPGAKLVFLAKKKGVFVEVLTGPSSVVFALLASGLSGQKFFFHGYLERDPDLCKAQIQMLEKESKQRQCTQVFIEAPYRSHSLFALLLDTLADSVQLSLSVHLTMPDALSQTLPVREWKKRPPLDLRKKPTVFLFFAT